MSRRGMPLQTDGGSEVGQPAPGPHHAPAEDSAPARPDRGRAGAASTHITCQLRSLTDVSLSRTAGHLGPQVGSEIHSPAQTIGRTGGTEPAIFSFSAVTDNGED